MASGAVLTPRVAPSGTVPSSWEQWIAGLASDCYEPIADCRCCQPASSEFGAGRHCQHASGRMPSRIQ